MIFEATQNKNSLLGAVDQKGEAGVVTTEEKIKNHSAKYGINYGLEWDLGAITPIVPGESLGTKISDSRNNFTVGCDLN